MKVSAILLVSALLFAACNVSAPIAPKVLAEDEKACYQFVQTHMLKDGGMLTNYHKKPPNKELATGTEVLSESQGLLLNYTAAIADRETFNAVYAFTKTHLDNKKIFVYRYDPSAASDAAYTVNAAVDDLRIIKALFRAGEAFSDPKLTKAAKSYASRFYKTNVEDGRLYDFYDTALFMKNEFITLCYLDLEALGLLTETDKRYQAVYDHAAETMEGGYISDQFPMFMTRYDYRKNKYEAPADINMIESVLTALNLSYAQKCPESTVAFLKKELAKGRIYASYKPDGTVKATIESTAVYALCAQLAQQLDDQQMYADSIRLMKKFMVRGSKKPLYGAFGDNNNVYSFDNLMALTALRSGVSE